MFADEIVAHRRASGPTWSAITAAMLHPVGLHAFAAALPRAHLRRRHRRAARRHLRRRASRWAGCTRWSRVYATFLNRAFDQVLMDVALHRCGVTFVLDRAGVTGDDGASHNGMWDMSILQVVPGLRLAAPRDATRLRELLREAVAGRRRPDRRPVPQGPAQCRPRGRRPAGGCDVLVRDGRPRRARSSASARWPRRASRSPTGWRPRASASPSSTRGGSSRSTPRSLDLARRAPAGGQRRGQRHRRRLRLGAAADPQRRAHRHPGAAARHPAGVPRPRQARRHPRARSGSPPRSSPAASSRT